MCIVFIEYYIEESMRTSYLHYMQKLKEQTGLKVYEGTDQLGLFVEVWADMPYSEYLSFKEERKHPGKDSVWVPMTPWIKGGSEKLHIWHFKEVE